MDLRICTGQVASVLLMLMAAFVQSAESPLKPGFYDDVCPEALPTIRDLVQRAIKREPRMGASLLRLHFHDCFVHGCDASILLDGEDSEKMASPNQGTARGFEVIDEIKAAVNEVCGSGVVSCADILTVAVRDSIVSLGGPSYDVPLGRRDSLPRNSSLADAEDLLPGPAFDFPHLLANFKEHGLSTSDLVLLSSAHTVGFTKCRFTRPDNNLDWLRQKCPKKNDTMIGFDDSPLRFDNSYFKNLVRGRGVLPSDQALFRRNDSESGKLVKLYSQNANAHRKDFAKAMIRMGNIRPLTGDQGEIRTDCRVPNSESNGYGQDPNY